MDQIVRPQMLIIVVVVPLLIRIPIWMSSYLVSEDEVVRQLDEEEGGQHDAGGPAAVGRRRVGRGYLRARRL